MGFYDRREWRELRFRVLRKYGWKCMACGASRADGAIIQVDHIKPASIYPELAWDESNLQVLCKLCNLGKSNVYADDFRPKQESQQGKNLTEIGRIVESIKQEINHAEQLGDDARKADLMRLYLNVQRKMREPSDSQELLTDAVRKIVEMDVPA